MRALLLALLVLAALAPSAASEPTLRSPCNDWLAVASDPECRPIHPGARMVNGCTLNWVLTDGARLYIGTANHCTGPLGEPLRVAGVPEAVGELVFKGRNDSAFYRIDESAHGLVDGALRQWGGPRVSPLGAAHRTPLPGEPLVHYGWGADTKDQPALRGRPAVTLFAVPNSAFTNSALFVFATASISGGDSGSPILTATGQAAGHATAAVFPAALACGATGACPPGLPNPSHVGIGVPLHTELTHFSRTLGKPLEVVTGDPLLALE